jgi:DNA-binding LacI/PurR family transcriptional regulator
LDVLVPKELGAVQTSQSAHVVLRRLDGIARACRRAGLSTSLQFLDPYRFLSLDELLEHLGPLHDGIVFLHDDLVARIEEHLIDCRIPFAVAGNTQRKSNAVLSSVREAYLELMKHLASIGRKRIAYLAGDPASPNSHLSVVQHAAAEYGLKLHRIYWVDREVSPVLDRLVSRELKEHGIDAVLCRNDHWALDALATFSSHGIGVPRDVVVVGCDDIAEAAQAVPSLATIAQPYEETGEAAVDCVDKMIRTGVFEFENLAIESRFVVRASALPDNGGSIAQVGVSNRKGRPIHAQEP